MEIRREINAIDVIAVNAFLLLVPFLELAARGMYWSRVSGWLDNVSYVEIARVIRFGGPLTAAHFWGLPAVMALAERLFSLSGFAAIVVVSLVSSILATCLIYRLYGPAVTVAFLILCPEWTRLSILGGSEPLFCLLLFCAWLLFRKDAFVVAAMFATLAATVRPVGAIAVCAIFVVLLLRKNYRALGLAATCSALIGLAYFAIVKLLIGTALVSVDRYASRDWHSALPVTFPFLRLFLGLGSIYISDPRTRLIQPLFCIALVTACLWLGWKHLFATWTKYPAEVFFVFAYLVFFACYNYQDVARFITRFAIPAYPLLLFLVKDRLPRNRYVLALAVIVSALVASADLVGVKAAFGFGFLG